jgi:hypothetical protein
LPNQKSAKSFKLCAFHSLKWIRGLKFAFAFAIPDQRNQAQTTQSQKG